MVRRAITFMVHTEPHSSYSPLRNSDNISFKHASHLSLLSHTRLARTPTTIELQFLLRSSHVPKYNSFLACWSTVSCVQTRLQTLASNSYLIRVYGGGIDPEISIAPVSPDSSGIRLARSAALCRCPFIGRCCICRTTVTCLSLPSALSKNSWTSSEPASRDDFS